MKVSEAKEILEKVVGLNFNSINSFDLELKNKGFVGQFLEKKYLEIHPGSKNLDFEDGELKSFKTINVNGKQKVSETVAITSISNSNISDYLKYEFEETNLYKKITNILFVAIDKTSKNIKDWFIYGICNFKINEEKYKDKITEDFNFIINEIKKNKKLSTYNGPNKILQIRSKDYKDKKTGKYHSVKNFSDKQYAFYFMKDFVEKLEIFY